MLVTTSQLILILTQEPTSTWPPRRGGRTLNSHAAASAERMICDPSGYSPRPTQSSTRYSDAVRQAISPQPGPRAVDR